MTETTQSAVAAAASAVTVATTPLATATPTVTPTPSPSPTATPTPAPRYPLTIAAVGDIMLARGVASSITADEPDGPFAHVEDLLQSADLTVGNLECVLSDEGEPEPKSYTFEGPPLGATGLADAGFDLVTLANNHSLDFGPDALLDTAAKLRAASVAAVGAGRDDGEAYQPVILEAHGLRIAFLAEAEVPDEAGYDMHAWTASAGKPGIAWVDEGRLQSSIRAAKAQADIVVVMFHFGIEGDSEPTDRQRELAHLAIDAGASLVLGAHPHVLQDVEQYGGGLIAYSLGNFVFDGFDGISNSSGILFVTFAADGSLSWRIEPVTIGDDGLPYSPG